MNVDGEKPLVGSSANMLGAREDGHDIPVNTDGNVQPRTGGISVAPGWRSLPLFLIPRRLQSEVKEARGNNKLACFRLGDLPFADAQFNELLVIRTDRPQHGTIEPSHEMRFVEYQNGLADTRDQWEIDES